MHWNDLIGRRIGPYEIIEELGRGGTARVYKAFQESMHRYVAMKVLVNDSEDRLGFVRRFEREVEAVAQLNHPNIVAVYDAGEVDDLVYLVMQCVEGGTFRQRLGRPLPVNEACSAMIQMARALQHAHTRGIVHRDVKPSNILIDIHQDGQLLLTDFGIAKLAGMRGLTKSGTTIGTPEYMAPEQAEGREIDARADVYSLGCVLYEALAGRAPFVGAAPVSVLYQQVHTPPESIRSLNPQVPRELARVIEVALAKRPEDRFSSAESFAHSLFPFTVNRERGVFAPPSAPLGVREATVPRELDLRRGAASGPMMPAAAPGAPAAGDMVLPSPAAPSHEDDTAWPAAPAARGLGAEGLDALFPDDPESLEARRFQAQSAPLSAHAQAPEHTGYLPGASLISEDVVLPPPASRVTSGPRPTIPLNAFRLPSRETATRPLDLPLTPEGQLDMEALMAQVEDQPIASAPDALAAPPETGWEPPPDLPPYEQWQDPSDVPPYTAWDRPAAGLGYLPPDAAGGFAGYDVLQPGVPNPWAGSPAALELAARQGHGHAGMVEPETLPPIWRPDDVDAPMRRRMPVPPSMRTPGRLAIGIGLAVLVALIAVVWVVLSASAMGVARQGNHPRPTATSVPAPTATPSPTATATPAGTPTPGHQQVLDAQARAAFQSILLATSPSISCSGSASQTTFGRSQTIYIKLCLAQSAPSGTFSIVLRHGGATVQSWLDYASFPGHSYWYWVYNLAPGNYNFLVTFNGGTAADLAFTVT